MEQILTLRYLGFPLKRISELLASGDEHLLGSLSAQRRVLRERLAAIERAEIAVGELIDRRKTDGTWEWEIAARAAARLYPA